MRFEVTVLGTNSALPCFGRNPSSQLLNHNDRLFLIDCGEGTQMRLIECDVRYMRIDYIFISHLHGDHVYGLPGLINTMSSQGRQNPLTVFGPTGIKELTETVLRLSESRVLFPIEFMELKGEGFRRIFENERLRVDTFPLRHRISTQGYIFREKVVELNIKPEAIEQYGLNFEQIRAVKAGEDITLQNGGILNHKLITEPPPPERSYAYCSDTAYFPEILPYIRGASLLYHEATFMHELLAKAEHSMHSTARQAGEIASRAGVAKLLIGHFSSRYQDLSPLLEEAREIFPATELAVEGKTFAI